jgi:hypothetical protein
MPLNPPPTIDVNLALCRILLTHSISTRKSEITFAVIDGDVAGAQDVADDVMGSFNSNMRGVFDNEVVCGPTLVTLGDGTSTPSIATSAAALLNGTAVIPNSLPPNVALLVKKATAFGGRRNRGRMFLPWCLDGTSINEGGTVAPAGVTAIQALVNAWLADLTAVNVPMIIANRVFNTPLPPHHVVDIDAGHVVTSLTVENLVATQRRRLGR